jgi:hypothetical protein
MELKLNHNSLSPANRNISITILISFEFLLFSFIILNDYDYFFYTIPVVVLAFILKLTWEHSYQILSSIFLFILVLNITIFVRHASRTKQQRDIQILYNLLQFEEFPTLDKQISKNENDSLTFDNNEYNIFFIETNPHSKIFTAKQLCSIESAAKNNPKSNVYVLSIRAVENENTTSLRLFYPNVKFMKLILIDLFKGNAKLI